MSTSTVISSVDSLPPSVSVEGLPRVPEHIPEEPGTSLSPSASMEGLPRVPEHTPVEPGTSQEQVGTEETEGKKTDLINHLYEVDSSLLVSWTSPFVM